VDPTDICDVDDQRIYIYILVVNKKQAAVSQSEPQKSSIVYCMNLAHTDYTIVTTLTCMDLEHTDYTIVTTLTCMDLEHTDYYSDYTNLYGSRTH
jgi:hypothetical protein